MSDQQSDASTPVRVRVRARHACQSCRKRKRKCNGMKPCGECVGYGYECSFQPRSSKAARRDAGPSHLNGPSRTNRLSGSLHIPRSPPVRNGDMEATEDRLPDHQPTKNGTISEAPIKNDSVLEPYKSRFVSAHSIIAYPRRLGMDLKIAKPPRLHSYAWNTGIRPERPCPIPSRVCDFLSLEQSRPYCDAYFNLINPLYPVLNRDNFLQRCKFYWSSPGLGVDFESAICGVIGLGSLFSGPTASTMEWEVVNQARLLLEGTVSQAPGIISLDHIVGWILRSLYLRLTTRPNLSWLSICTTMHLAESIGLHQEVDTVCFAVEDAPQPLGSEELELRRRIFWVAWSLNRLFAAEYGRSRAHVDNIRCRKPSAQDSGFVCDLIEMTDLLHSGSVQETGPTGALELSAALENLSCQPESHSAFVLLKGEVCLILCRRLRLTSRKLSTEQIGMILAIQRKALAECRSSALRHHPWWSVLSLPFHCVCLLLSINTHESMEMLNEAMETLVDVAMIYDVHLAREAVRTARSLIGQAAQRKREELVPLEELSQEHGSASSVNPLSETSDLMDSNMFESLLEDDLGWTQFFGSEMLQP